MKILNYNFKIIQGTFPSLKKIESTGFVLTIFKLNMFNSFINLMRNEIFGYITKEDRKNVYYFSIKDFLITPTP